jgi:dihydrodipicolinate synthase/N-acetylneuraminate lyase
MPLLTHYRADGGIMVDQDRMASHVRSLRPHVRQFLLAGSTGDGWELGTHHLLDLVRLSRDDGVFDSDCGVLFGLLRHATEQVVEWAELLEGDLKAEGLPAARFAGFAVCPPADPRASQEDIRRHYERVLEATTHPVAVYQLPQITGCEIEPSTMRALAENPRIAMFKDTSGADTVARSGSIGNVLLLRGAEGGYAEALRPDGPYDGWLLSTANVFAGDFRRILALRAASEPDQARKLSDLLSQQIKLLFEAAQSVPFGNAFSNANRAADHVLAYGSSWPSVPAPLTISGDRLPRDLLAAAANILIRHPGVPENGYMMMSA